MPSSTRHGAGLASGQLPVVFGGTRGEGVFQKQQQEQAICLWRPNRGQTELCNGAGYDTQLPLQFSINNRRLTTNAW